MWSRTKTWDPEGFVCTLPAIATVLFGVFAGHLLRTAKTAAEKTAWMFVAGNLLLFAGVVLDPWMPINKNLWTVSYALFTAGMAFNVYALAYWVVDTLGFRRWAYPFTVFGMNALAILQGDRISPFMTGWFAHPNFSFFSQAGTMAVAGWNLFGLRLFAALMGTLMVLPFYGLTRMWFGVRTAIIASVLLAVMDASLYFGRVGLNNIATTFFIVVGLFFLVRGLRDLRTLYFVLSGYAFSFGLPLRNSVRFLVLLASPLTALACNVIRTLPTIWLYGNKDRSVADTLHEWSGWMMLPIAFFSLMAILKLLRWAMLPVTRYPLASQSI
jgi:exosortase/archaeosortase family protein